MKTAAVHNLGCKVNAYEAESMEQMLVKAGYEIVPFGGEKNADVCIINTCAVTNIADHKSRQMLHKARKLYPDAVVIASGCYAQEKAESLARDPAIDIVLGNNRKRDLISILKTFEDRRASETDEEKLRRHALSEVEDISKDSEYEDMPLTEVKDRTRVFVKMQDGCNQFCTYCIIPYLRGRIRSRDEDSILREVERMADKGFSEFVLTGIHLTSYGLDNNHGSLIDVIEKVSQIPGVKRIRLGSLEPRVITEDFAKRLAAIPSFCPHFHLSLQSGSDSVLRRMNRRYTTQEFAESVGLLRRTFDRPAITTDIIVGFPQETEEEFEETLAFVEKIRFYECHVFKYSRRAGTVADRMGGQIPQSIKHERSKRLIAEAQRQAHEYRSSFKNEVKDVLIEQTETVDSKKYFTGLTGNYIKIYIPCETDRQPEALSGSICRVRVLQLFQDGCAGAFVR
ncbi:MAG: tRNA (N(6)-L-threonylcarbamoyladenosine(37)-C(2))-methylthiotransferase MtaB [Lachnospiraceae bacterium]